LAADLHEDDLFVGLDAARAFETVRYWFPRRSALPPWGCAHPNTVRRPLRGRPFSR